MYSPRNKYVAQTLSEFDIGTLLFDLLTPEEEDEDRYTRHLRFDIDLLTKRLVDATRWIKTQEDVLHLPIGYFGSSTGPRQRWSRRQSLGKRSPWSYRVEGDLIWPGHRCRRSKRRRC